MVQDLSVEKGGQWRSGCFELGLGREKGFSLGRRERVALLSLHPTRRRALGVDSSSAWQGAVHALGVDSPSAWQGAVFINTSELPWYTLFMWII